MPVFWKSLGIMFTVLAVWGTGLVGRAHSQGAPMPAPLTRDFAADLQPEEFTGALDIRIHPEDGKLEPPAELLLRDPRGRKIGCDPNLGQTYGEIPLAHYELEGIDDAMSGAPGPQTGIIEIRNPVPGKYTLEIIGKSAGQYSAAIRGYNQNLKDSTIVLKKTTITPGARRRFSFRYSGEDGNGRVTPAPSGHNP